MNQQSSRGHAILQLKLQQCASETCADTLTSKINLVDLAGSERNPEAADKKSSAETHAINVSLSALVSVVAALTSKSKHVPYRDSKLTHLLKDCLGGRSNTYLIATIAPTASCFQESISTLKFADRASSVVNSVKRNAHSDLAGLLERKDREIRRLTELLTDFSRAHGHEPRRDAEKASKSVQQAQQLQRQIQELQVRRSEPCCFVYPSCSLEMPTHLGSQR